MDEYKKLKQNKSNGNPHQAHQETTSHAATQPTSPINPQVIAIPTLKKEVRVIIIKKKILLLVASLKGCWQAIHQTSHDLQE